MLNETLDTHTVISEEGERVVGLPVISIQSERVPKLNFACHQNSFSVLRHLQLNQNSGTSIRNITAILDSSPTLQWYFDSDDIFLNWADSMHFSFRTCVKNQKFSQAQLEK